MVSANLLEFASKKFDFNTSTLQFISDSTNQIYSFAKSNKKYILRFSERPIKHTTQINAEMDWLYYLSSNNINVSLPLKTDDGSFSASFIDDDKNYIISAFNMVGGQPWDKNDTSKWNDRTFYNWGKAMGDIHRLTKDYVPSDKSNVRSEFTGREALSDSIKSCPSVNAIAEELIKEMMSLPKDKDSYGLIHYDIHPWNFLIDGDKINVFDFDDSLYGWFALDIGIALYHGLWWGRKDHAAPIPNDYTSSIISNFLKGYLSANNLSSFWISKIPLFMKFRQICKFSWFYNPDSTDEHQTERMRNIENDILFTDCKIGNLFQI